MIARFVAAACLLVVSLLTRPSHAASFLTIRRITDASTAFDQVLQESLDKHIADLDPVRIKGISLHPMPLVTIKMHEVEVDGLGDMERVGDVKLIHSTDGVRTLRVQLRADRVFYTARSQVILAGKSLARTLFAHADDVRAHLEVNYDTRRDEVSLQRFKIENLSKLRLRYEGSPILIEQIENMLLKVVSHCFSGSVRSILETTFSKRLDRVFASSLVLKDIMRSLK